MYVIVITPIIRVFIFDWNISTLMDTMLYTVLKCKANKNIN